MLVPMVPLSAPALSPASAFSAFVLLLRFAFCVSGVLIHNNN